MKNSLIRIFNFIRLGKVMILRAVFSFGIIPMRRFFSSSNKSEGMIMRLAELSGFGRQSFFW